MSYIEKKYGNDGYAVWFKLLEELGSNRYHYLDLEDDVQMMFLTDKCNVEDDVLLSIIDDLVKLGEFDKKLWTDRILVNESFLESIQDAYRKRATDCPSVNQIISVLNANGRKIAHPDPPNGRKITGINPQRKEKERKEKESKLNGERFEASSEIPKSSISQELEDQESLNQSAQDLDREPLYIKDLDTFIFSDPTIDQYWKNRKLPEKIKVQVFNCLVGKIEEEGKWQMMTISEIRGRCRKFIFSWEHKREEPVDMKTYKTKSAIL